MKQISFISIFIFLFFTNSIAQNQWNFLNPHDQSSIQIFYQTDTGDLLGHSLITMGYNSTITRYFISYDHGDTWNKLIDASLFERTRPVFSDYNGEIYVGDKLNIYRLNPDTHNYALFTKLPGDNFRYIKDIEFKSDGNMVVLTDENLFLIDQNGTIVIQKNHEDFLAQKIFIGGNGTHFLYGSREIRIFNDNLILEEETTETPTSFCLFFENERIFTCHEYSDDYGQSWTEYELSLPGTNPNMAVSKSGKIVMFRNNVMYVSYDYGNSFLTVDDLDYDYIYDHVFVFENRILITSDECNENHFLRTFDDGSSFEEIDIHEGEVEAFTVYAGNSENLILGNCLKSNKYYKFPNENDWNIYEEINTWPNEEDFVLPLRTNNFLLLNGDDIYLSTDFGKTWDLKFDPGIRVATADIITKADVSYLVGQNTVFYSSDLNHETWLEGDPVDGIASYLPSLTINANGIMFANIGTDYEPIFLKKSIHNEFDSGFNNPLESLEKIEKIESAYYGKQLYIFAQNYSTDELKVYISLDEGKTYSSSSIVLHDTYKEGELGFKVDHNDYLYVYSERLILVSKDKGQSWIDYTPQNFEQYSIINDIDISFDNILYVALSGQSVMKHGLNVDPVENKFLNIKVYDDQNENCVYDQNEEGITGIKYIVDDFWISSTDQNGESSLVLITEPEKISLIYDENLYAPCLEETAIDLDPNTNTAQVDIQVEVLKYCADLHIAGSSLMRRCFPNQYKVTLENIGTARSEETRIVFIADPYFEDISFDIPVESQNGLEYVLIPGDLEKYGKLNFKINYTVSCDAELGQEHCVSFDAICSDPCYDASNRGPYYECQENIGSYDPNDKKIFVDGIESDMNYLEEDSKIEYLIRFQNTGTDTAFNIRIEDPISDKYDINSLTPLVASHAYTWAIENKVLFVDFKNVLLVDSLTNEPDSHGFIKFSVALNEDVADGENLNNQAFIYFDFNDPIETNIVTITKGEPLNSSDHYKNDIKYYPNPTSNNVVFQLNKSYQTKTNLSLFDIQGNLILNQDYYDSTIEIDCSSFTNGTYFFKITNHHVTSSGKIIKI